MSKNLRVTVVGVLVAAVSAGIAVLLVRRSRKEPPPVSPTVPRVENLRTLPEDPALAAS